MAAGFPPVAARVVDAGQSPAHVADQLELPLSEVYEALSYYYANIDEMKRLKRENEAAFEQIREASLKPKESVL